MAQYSSRQRYMRGRRPRHKVSDNPPLALAALAVILILGAGLWFWLASLSLGSPGGTTTEPVQGSLSDPTPLLTEPAPPASPEPSASSATTTTAIAPPVLQYLGDPSQWRLRIPVIDVSAPVDGLGYAPNGSMAAPTTASSLGWFDKGTLPGRVGNAVLAGHVDWQRKPAVFWELDRLGSGDRIFLDTATLTLEFRVQKQDSYPSDRFPLNEVFGSTPMSRLNLITCDGNYNRVTQSYDSRLVVYAELIGAKSRS